MTHSCNTLEGMLFETTIAYVSASSMHYRKKGQNPTFVLIVNWSVIIWRFFFSTEEDRRQGTLLLEEFTAVTHDKSTTRRI